MSNAHSYSSSVDVNVFCKKKRRKFASSRGAVNGTYFPTKYSYGEVQELEF